MSIIKYTFTFILFTSFSMLYGQRTETAIDFRQKTNRLIYELDNDVIFKTDRYYTAGMSLSYQNRNIKKSPAQLLLRSKKRDFIEYGGFGMEYRLYTPYYTPVPDSIKDDRPYSAYFMVTNYGVIIDPSKNLKIFNEIGLGILGPTAAGKEFQTKFHDFIGAPLPEGWEFQIRNTFLIDYQFRIEKGFFDGWTSEHIIPFAEARIGTLTDRIGAGINLTLGNVNESLEKYGSDNNKNPFNWSFIIEAKVLSVFYDARLQGGLFNGEEFKSLTKDQTITGQYQLRSGINLYYKSLYLRFMTHYVSKPYEAAENHFYNSAVFGVSF